MEEVGSERWKIGASSGCFSTCSVRHREGYGHYLKADFTHSWPSVLLLSIIFKVRWLSSFSVDQLVRHCIKPW